MSLDGAIRSIVLSHRSDRTPTMHHIMTRHFPARPEGMKMNEIEDPPFYFFQVGSKHATEAQRLEERLRNRF
jgi:hypothetical protein